jgi:hypothetical protein
MPVYIGPLPPLDLVKSLLSYDSTTGIFRWRINQKWIKIGDVAGSYDNGYRVISISGTGYLASRLAWLSYHGVDPHPLQIDHIDRNTGNNRIANLRAVTHFENGQNRAIGVSGIRGVEYQKRDKRWRARITTAGDKQINGPYRLHLYEAVEDREWMVVHKFYPHLHRK